MSMNENQEQDQAVDYKEKEAHIKRQNEKNKQLEAEIAQMKAEKEALLNQQAELPQPSQQESAPGMTQDQLQQAMATAIQQQKEQEELANYHHVFNEMVQQDPEAVDLFKEVKQSAPHQLQALDFIFKEATTQYKKSPAKDIIKKTLKNEKLKNDLLANANNPAKLQALLEKAAKLGNEEVVEKKKTFADVPDLSHNSQAIEPMSKVDREAKYKKWMS